MPDSTAQCNPCSAYLSILVELTVRPMLDAPSRRQLKRGAPNSIASLLGPEPQ